MERGKYDSGEPGHEQMAPTPVPSQNSIRAENGKILPPCSVKNLNSTMSLYEDRETLSVSACARGVYKGWVKR